MERELVNAVRPVLITWSYGERLQSADVEFLRQHAQDEDDLPLDDLACLIIHRECAIALEESQQERKAVSFAGPIARFRKTG